jgi:nucleotide-binding universal stress UspA family protein
MSFSFRKTRGDPQPTEKIAVLLASSGGRFSKVALERARELAGGEPIGVLVILRIFGSSFGLQHPALLPNQKEVNQGMEIVRTAIRTLERRGCDVDGQVAATRHPVKQIVSAARRRQARIVVMDGPSTTGLRRFIEGDVTASIRRRLKGQAIVEVVSIVNSVLS